MRLPSNDHPQRNITELLTRPVGTPSPKPVVRFKSFLYQAANWRPARRVVVKVAFHFGELFPRVGFIVTDLATSSRAVVRFYNRRGMLVADQLAAAAGENRRTIDQDGRYYWLLLAESHLTRRLLVACWGRGAAVAGRYGGLAERNKFR